MDTSKAGLLNRAVSALIDLIVVAVLSGLPKVGFLASLLYLLIRDGFPGGQSLGKRLVGLTARIRNTERVVTFRESIIRNLPFAVARIVWGVPLIGWIAAMLVLTFEGLLVVGSSDGRRLGDEMANTHVVEGG